MNEEEIVGTEVEEEEFDKEMFENWVEDTTHPDEAAFYSPFNSDRHHD